MGLAYLNRNVDATPSLIEQAAVQEELPADNALSVQPPATEEMLELPTLPAQDAQRAATPAPEAATDVVQDATN
jgi:hypothetical protein